MFKVSILFLFAAIRESVLNEITPTLTMPEAVASSAVKTVSHGGGSVRAPALDSSWMSHSG